MLQQAPFDGYALLTDDIKKIVESGRTRGPVETAWLDPELAAHIRKFCRDNMEFREYPNVHDSVILGKFSHEGVEVMIGASRALSNSKTCVLTESLGDEAPFHSHEGQYVEGYLQDCMDPLCVVRSVMVQ